MNLLRKSIVIFVALGSVSVANADPMVFRVDNVTFDDGGTLTGTFSFDPDNTSFFDVNLTSSFGSGDFQGTTHISHISSVYNNIAGESALAEFRVRDASGTYDLFLRFSSPLYSGNLQSDIVIDPLDSFELAISAPIYLTRNVVSGRVVSEDMNYVLYASNRSDGTIYQIDASGNVTPFVVGLGQPNEIVIDNQGDLLVADPGIDPIDRILRITPDGSVSDYFVFDDARDNPEGLALRDDGTLFVSGTMELNNAPPSNTAPNALVAISPAGIATDFASVGPQENLGVAINSEGVLFVTDIANNGSIWRVLPSGESALLVNNLGRTPWAIEVGLDGSIFVAMAGLGQILQIQLTEDLEVASVSTYVQISYPISLAIDEYGRLFVGQIDRVSMVDIDRSVRELADGFDTVSGVAVASLPPTTNQVEIDIKPGETPNDINLKSKGVISVAILTTDSFDASQVDWDTVSFGPAGATEFHGRAHIEDVDDDGDLDLLLHFNTQDTGIACGDTDATLTGALFDGEAITGSGSINTVNCLAVDATVKVLIGDKDCFGLGGVCSEGDRYVEDLGGVHFADNRDAGEPLGVDHWGTRVGLAGPSFDIGLDLGGATPSSASFTIFIAGLEHGATFFFNGSSVGTYAGIPIDQVNPAITLTFDVPISLLSDTNILNMSVPDVGLVQDGFIIDHLELTVETDTADP